jgi:hypothetical protein
MGGSFGFPVQRNHLRFEKLPLEKGRKMPQYKVINEVLCQTIGIIHWRGGWRQYVFRADADIDMSRSCHKEIDNFIDNLMEKRKLQNK